MPEKRWRRHLREYKDGKIRAVKSHMKQISGSYEHQEAQSSSSLTKSPKYDEIAHLNIETLEEELEEQFKNAKTHRERKIVIKRLSTYQMYAVRMSFAGGRHAEELGDKAERLRQLRLKLDPKDKYFEEIY